MLPSDIMFVILMHIAEDRNKQAVVNLFAIDGVSTATRVPIEVWRCCIHCNLLHVIPHSTYWNWNRLFSIDLDCIRAHKFFATRLYEKPCKGHLSQMLSFVAANDLEKFISCIYAWPQLFAHNDYDECYMFTNSGNDWGYYCHDHPFTKIMCPDINWFTFSAYNGDPVQVLQLSQMIRLMHTKRCYTGMQPPEWNGCELVARHLASARVIDI